MIYYNPEDNLPLGCTASSFHQSTSSKTDQGYNTLRHSTPIIAPDTSNENPSFSDSILQSTIF